MRHFVLTRSAYGPAYDLEANRRRLAITLAVTVPAMAAQWDRAWTWCVLLDPDDPLRAEREAAFSSAGSTLFLDGRLDPSTRQDDTALGAWALPPGARLTTRLDDDDAIAPWFLDAMARTLPPRQSILAMPRGWWYARGRVRPLHYVKNMFLSLWSPDGAHHIMETAHTSATRLGPTVVLEDRPSWLWVRHADARGGLLQARKRPGPEVRATFPIDWAALDAAGYG